MLFPSGPTYNVNACDGLPQVVGVQSLMLMLTYLYWCCGFWYHGGGGSGDDGAGVAGAGGDGRGVAGVAGAGGDGRGVAGVAGAGGDGRGVAGDDVGDSSGSCNGDNVTASVAVKQLLPSAIWKPCFQGCKIQNRYQPRHLCQGH